MEKEFLVVEDSTLSSPWDRRYIVISKETGEVLDDAQGYGYKSKPKAYAAWAWKNRTQEQVETNKQVTKAIEKWTKANKSVVTDLENALFYALKDREEFKLTVKNITKFFQEQGINVESLPFSVKDFIKWFKKH